MTFLDFYYVIKPVVPRRVQISVRRCSARIKRSFNRSVWPIDPAAAKKPDGWNGWPGGKEFALVLNHDVDTAMGYEKCGCLMQLEQQMGFRSTFYFVPEGYAVSPEMRKRLKGAGFDVGIHGLLHDGKMFRSRRIFLERAGSIGKYIRDWGATGFSSPSMHRNLDWIADLDIKHDISTFDTDPFEPQPEGVRTIFPFCVRRRDGKSNFVELPYTMPQDHCLFVVLKEKNNSIWKKKLDWIAEKGGMALLNSHPDYMNFKSGKCSLEEYPAGFYIDFLEYVKGRYGGRFWHALACEVAAFWEDTYCGSGQATRSANRPPETTGNIAE